MTTPDELLMSGHFSKAAKAYESGRKDGVLDKPFDITNYTISLLNLGRLDEASSVSSALLKASPDSASSHIYYGIAEWLLGRPQNAAKAWGDSMKCTYTDLGGGIHSASLYYYASMRLSNQVMMAEAIKKLSKLWKKGGRWPKPIAGFLLKKLGDDEFFGVSRSPISGLSIRHQCQARFWLGVKTIEEGDRAGAKAHLLASREFQIPAILEAEYYLAQWELERLTLD